jgi:hypothetical protein
MRRRGGSSPKRLKSSASVKPRDGIDSASARIAFERARFEESTASIRSSIVSAHRNRVTVTAPSAPIRCARLIA